jgi:hypothetical protein
MELRDLPPSFRARVEREGVLLLMTSALHPQMRDGLKRLDHHVADLLDEIGRG